jgi:ribosome-associated protein
MAENPMEESERPSKTRRKREMKALQETGAELAELSPELLAQFDLPEQLLEALLEAQRIRDFEGRRRQMQYVGKLMRSVDPAPIHAQLEQLRGDARAHTRLNRMAEQWRDRLLREDDAAAALGAEFPTADLKHIRTLVASIKHDNTSGRPPRNSRELFRNLREIIGKRESGAKR